MKNKLFHSITVLCMALIGFSCSDDDTKNTKDLLGAWGYVSPHFVFEYAQDSVVVTMDKGKPKAWAVKDIRTNFLDMAQEKMGDYFRGMEFVNEKELNIRMLFADGAEDQLKASYLCKNDIVQVSLDTADIKRLTGKTLNIPKISFKYSIEGGQMQMYLDKSYIQSIVSMMTDQLVKMLVPMMIDLDKIPELVRPAVTKAMEEELKNQIPGILEQVKQLEIGINLGRYYSNK